MKITKSQLKRIIKEQQTPFRHVIGAAEGIFGRPMQIDEEDDGNLVIVADEAEIEKHYGDLMSTFPHGEMTEDGFATGEYEDMSHAPFRESKMKITMGELRKIIKEEMSSVTQLHPSSTRVASTTEGELKVWLRLVGPENIEKALKGKNDLTEDLIAALREYDALRR